MGLSPSKRASSTFLNSTEFITSCDSVFDEFLTLTHHRFPGIFPYQLSDAACRLHHHLRSLSFSLIKRWVSSPPSQAQVDRAYRASIHPPAQETLSRDEFRLFAVALFTDAVVSAAVKEAAVMVPLCAAEIAGVGVATRARRGVIGGLIVAYALTAATSIYISLGRTDNSILPDIPLSVRERPKEILRGSLGVRVDLEDLTTVLQESARQQWIQEFATNSQSFRENSNCFSLYGKP